MESPRLCIVNAFVDPAADTLLHSGNPAGVFLLTMQQNTTLSDEIRQKIAAEVNLSETAFVVQTELQNYFQIRWFTPAVEVTLCGHATLAAAHALLEIGWADRRAPIRFQTRESGQLEVESKEESGKLLAMTFPLLVRQEEDRLLECVVASALGLKGGVEKVIRSDHDVVVVATDEDVVQAARPVKEDLERIETRGVVLAARTSNLLVSRFFAPRVGIPEDPVTGSAYCALAAILLKEGERTKAQQLSARGGTLWVTRRGRHAILEGEARMFTEGRVNW